MSFLSPLWSPWSEPMRNPAVTVVFPRFDNGDSKDLDVTVSFMGTANAAEAKRVRDLCIDTSTAVGEELRVTHGMLRPWATISRSASPAFSFREDGRLSEKFTLFMKGVGAQEYNQVLDAFRRHAMPSDVEYTVAVKV